MSSRTLIPAFRRKVGDWDYFVCSMKYGEVARQMGFAHEMAGNKDLGYLAQRDITNRVTGITEHLLSSPHRFLGGIVVAVQGGDPKYTTLIMDDPAGILSGLDNGFGVLTFDDTQRYFVLDGQHRLRAIKEAIEVDQTLLQEDICVLIVTHCDSEEGRVRTRRLFSNINRNAKKTDSAEDIALDEDDSFAVLTRRMLNEHPFLKKDGRVRVILSTTEDGGVKLAGNSIPKTDGHALTSITVVYDLLQHLSYDCPSELRNPALRPSDDILDEAYTKLTARMDALLENCGHIRARLEAAQSAKDVRAPKNAEGQGHPFMRPVVQKAVASVIASSVQQGLATWDELMPRLSQLKWEMKEAPWTAVATVDDKNQVRMLVGKDNTDLLRRLLQAHLAPLNQAEIKRVRKAYRDLRGVNYPISEEDMAQRLAAGTTVPTISAAPVAIVEISDHGGSRTPSPSPKPVMDIPIQGDDDALAEEVED